MFSPELLWEEGRLAHGDVTTGSDIQQAVTHLAHTNVEKYWQMGNKTIHSDQSINQTVVTFALLYCSCTSKVNADILWCVVSWDTPYTSSSSVSASSHSPTVSSRFFLLGGSFSRRPPILKNYHYSFYWHFSKLFIIKIKEIFPNLKSNVNKYCMFLFCKKMILK